MSDDYPDGMSPDQIAALRALAKEELRKRLAAVRRTLSAETRAAHAAKTAAHVIAHEAYRSAKVVLAYSALRFEVDPKDVIERAWADGKRVALPRTVPETRGLTLHLYEPSDTLIESGFVVKEPLPTAPDVEPDQIDLVLVPGLGFDLRGHRLGYGQGYYDRLLPRLPRATRMALAFELSLLAEVPAAAHDVPVAWLITERRVIECVSESG